MAITATFTANFSSFYDAVQKADVKLKDFGTGAEKVGGQLSRLADQFSGRKLIQEATLMAEAVERIGGTSKLTQAELAKVGTKAQEAVTKMRALGLEVPAGLQKIADQTQNLNAKQTQLVGTLKNVAGAFGLVFSAQQVIGFIGKVFNAADAIKDMSDRLGLSIEAVQRFDYAAKQTGTTMDTVERAIFTMNKALAGGEKSTVKALEDAGLQFAKIRAMEPGDAFTAIAEAVGQIPDPMLQSKVATELFGKSALELLPAIKEGFVGIGAAAPVMADETVEALERAKQAWENFGNAAVVHTGNLLAALAELPDIAKDVASSGQKIAIFLENVRVGGMGYAIAMAGVAKSSKAGDIELKAMNRTLPKTAEELRAAEEAAKKFAAEQKKSIEAMREFRNFIGLRQMEDARAAMDAQAKQIEANVELEFELGKMYNANAAALGAYAGNVGLYTQQWAGYMALAPGITQNITNNGKALAEIPWTDDLDRLERVLSGIQTEFAQMAVAGVRAMREIDQAWKDTTLSKGQKTSATIVAGLGAAASMTEGTKAGGVLSGAASGAAIGSMFGPWGTAIGAGVGAIAGFVKGRKIERELNAQKQALIDSAGGWHALNSAAAKAGVTLEKVLNAKTVQAYEAAVRELQGAIEFQDQAMATLNETAQRYGFTLEELGPAMQRQELDKQAQQLFKDWEVLNAAGIDTVAITSRMSEAINAYLAQAMALGTEVPAAMKPMLEEMVRMGQLTDASGNRIDSLEDAGISFAMTMSEGFKALIDEVGKLTQAIARGLGVALDSTTDKIVKMPKTIGVDVVYNDPGFHGEIQVPAGESVPSFATGSGGKYLNFGSGTLAMLHGREKITPAGASEGGGDVSELRAEVQGLRADLARQQRLLPKQLRDALLLAS